jgi:DNA polymerase I-like protein with 3'-5' exonuclease and polymerase domains
VITIDFETYYDKEFSLSKITTEEYIRSEQFEVIGVAAKVDDQQTQWCTGSKEQIAKFLHDLDLPSHDVLAHHMAFDGAILAWQFGIRPKYYLDTLSMARPLTGLTVGGSLAALAKKFELGAKGTEVVNALGKRREDFSPQEIFAYGTYCMNDVNLTYELFKILKPHSTTKELYIIDLMLRMYIDPVLELDKEKLTHHLSNVQTKKEELMRRISDAIGKDDLMSNMKFADVLKKLGVEPPMKVSLRTNKMAYAFGKTDYEFKALLEHEDPRVQAVVSARLGIKSTLEETRTISFLGIADRGALPIMLNYYGAHTGRASGGDKMNLQNLPRGGTLRKSIKAPEGHVVIAVDSAQIEARVVAWLAGQDDLVEDFRNGVDIYSKFASDVYERPIDKSIDKVERFVGKTCILGLGYGMGKDKFKSTLKIGMAGVSVDLPLEDAERIVKLYRQKYERITSLWADADKALPAIANGFDYKFGATIALCATPEGIRLPNDMLVRYPGLHKTNEGFVYTTKRGSIKIYGGKVVENVVQALARIVVFDQMAKIDQEFRKRDSADTRFKVALTVHDEVVAVVPKIDAQRSLDFMIKVMSTPPQWAQGLPVACEGDFALTYGDCK